MWGWFVKARVLRQLFPKQFFPHMGPEWLEGDGVNGQLWVQACAIVVCGKAINREPKKSPSGGGLGPQVGMSSEWVMLLVTTPCFDYHNLSSLLNK